LIILTFAVGELADGVATKYGDKTLERYAKDIDINFNTLRRYRAMHRRYPDNKNRPKSMAVAKALASYPDREIIIQNYPDITEANALMAVKEFKRRKKRGKYNDLVLHALVTKACRLFNSVLSDNSELEHILCDIERYNEIDFEYIQKILDAAQTPETGLIIELADYGPTLMGQNP
jgi:hypothetical protein